MKFNDITGTKGKCVHHIQSVQGAEDRNSLSFPPEPAKQIAIWDALDFKYVQCMICLGNKFKVT